MSRLWRKLSIRGEVRDFWSGEPDFPAGPHGEDAAAQLFRGWRSISGGSRCRRGVEQKPLAAKIAKKGRRDREEKQATA